MSLHSRLNPLNVRLGSHAPSLGQSQYNHSKKLNSRCRSIQSEDWSSDSAHPNSMGYQTTTLSGNGSVGQNSAMYYDIHFPYIIYCLPGKRCEEQCPHYMVELLDVFCHPLSGDLLIADEFKWLPGDFGPQCVYDLCCKDDTFLEGPLPRHCDVRR